MLVPRAPSSRPFGRCRRELPANRLSRTSACRSAAIHDAASRHARSQLPERNLVTAARPFIDPSDRHAMPSAPRQAGTCRRGAVADRRLTGRGRPAPMTFPYFLSNIGNRLTATREHSVRLALSIADGSASGCGAAARPWLDQLEEDEQPDDDEHRGSEHVAPALEPFAADLIAAP